MSTDIRAFDYSALGVYCEPVKEATAQIRQRLTASAEHIIEIGMQLLEVKGYLGHGKFCEWIEAEFRWSHDTAGRFMNVANRFSGNPEIAEMGPSVLYLLASPSTPDSAVAEALERSQAGEKITVRDAQEIRDRHKADDGSERDERIDDPTDLEGDEYEESSGYSAVLGCTSARSDFESYVMPDAHLDDRTTGLPECFQDVSAAQDFVLDCIRRWARDWPDENRITLEAALEDGQRIIRNGQY